MTPGKMFYRTFRHVVFSAICFLLFSRPGVCKRVHFASSLYQKEVSRNPLVIFVLVKWMSGYPNKSPYTFMLLCGERHCESKVLCPRTQHNEPGQSSHPPRSICVQRAVHCLCFIFFFVKYFSGFCVFFLFLFLFLFTFFCVIFVIFPTSCYSLCIVINMMELFIFTVTSCLRQAQATDPFMPTWSQVSKGFHWQLLILGQSRIRCYVSWWVQEPVTLS